MAKHNAPSRGLWGQLPERGMGKHGVGPGGVNGEIQDTMEVPKASCSHPFFLICIGP